MNSPEGNPPSGPPNGNPSQDRPDASSSHIREDVAMTGRCGNVHLPSGRTCVLPERHQGSCRFVGPGDTGHPAGN
ncbi:hypothetical protein BJQ89_02589 [Arthrobacter sp. ES1]|nr:hypothetical protein [Arthrobacter sp. ES1]